MARWSRKSIPVDFVVTENGCFNCTSHKPGKRGYPRTYRGLVYRVVFEQMFGEVPKGQLVRHTCDNTMCINPEHLILGTPKDNLMDAFERNRMPLGSDRPNAKITEEQAKEVKRLLKMNVRQIEIAKKLGINYCTVKQIKQGRTWKHVV